MIIDIHSHVGRLIKDKWLQHAMGSHPTATAEDYIIAMDKAGITMGVTFPCLELDNKYQAEIQKKYPDRIISFAWINARKPDAISEFKYCVEKLGIKGLKLHGWWHQFSYCDHILLDPLLEICNKYNLPVLAHAMGDNPLTSPLQLEEMAKSFPNVTFIMSHAGGVWLYDDALLAVKRTKNIIIDTTAMQGYWITKIVQEIGPERVAMGSDYPWNYLESTLKAIEVAVSDPKSREWVMGRTAARILRIKSE